MLKRNGDEFTFGTHIYFRNLGRRNPVTGVEEPKRKTNLYGVWNNDEPDHPLGSILWNSGWRKYVFRPLAGTVYEETCLREISQFIEEETKAQKSKGKTQA
jgi:hypothetical protein